MLEVIVFLIVLGVLIARSIKQNSYVFNPTMVCPYCRFSNCVETRRLKRKQGISGGKATGALMTGGLSLFATGLSRKVMTTEAHCTHCNNYYSF